MQTQYYYNKQTTNFINNHLISSNTQYVLIFSWLWKNTFLELFFTLQLRSQVCSSITCVLLRISPSSPFFHVNYLSNTVVGSSVKVPTFWVELISLLTVFGMVLRDPWPRLLPCQGAAAACFLLATVFPTCWHSVLLPNAPHLVSSCYRWPRWSLGPGAVSLSCTL